MEHPEYGEVIQLQGDKRDAMQNFLVEVGIASKELVKVSCFVYQHVQLDFTERKSRSRIIRKFLKIARVMRKSTIRYV